MDLTLSRRNVKFAAIGLVPLLAVLSYALYIIKANARHPVRLINQLKAIPVLGDWLVTKAISVYSPYSGSIYPRVESISETGARISVMDRRSIRNPFSSIHFAALMNLGEFTGAIVVVTQLQKTKRRGIPVGASAEFKKKARGKIYGVVENVEIPQGATSYTCECKIMDSQNDVVAIVRINWIISESKPSV